MKKVLRDFEEKLCEHAQLLSLLFIWNSSKNTVVSPWAKLVYLRSLSPLKNAFKISIPLPPGDLLGSPAY